jgi:hypothetical protein
MEIALVAELEAAARDRPLAEIERLWAKGWPVDAVLFVTDGKSSLASMRSLGRVCAANYLFLLVSATSLGSAILALFSECPRIQIRSPALRLFEPEEGNLRQRVVARPLVAGGTRTQ